MSSILTNAGAMTALQTLKQINKRLSSTQDMISTGKRVNNARDNAAVWAIAKTMQSDVSGFARISDSLNLGQSTVSVARRGAETVADLLTQMKEKIVAAQEENVDRTKIQNDIDALKDQIRATVGASQFNGQNLLNNRDRTAGTGDISVLASLDRVDGGTVRSSDITVFKKDLSLEVGSIGGGLVSLAAGSNNITGAADATAVALAGGATPATTTGTFGASATQAVTAGTGFVVWISGSAGTAPSNTTTGHEVRYIARDGDTMAEVTKGLAAAFNQYVTGNLGAGDVGTINATVSGNQLTITGADTAGDNFSVRFDEYASHATTTVAGGLEYVNYIDVTTSKGGDAALAAIDGLIGTAIDAAASFGSAERRLETQYDFIASLSASLKSGIGSLVDADMEETAARLQSLQVQQQLSVTSLSIANQAPQYLLQLFRG